MDFSSWSGSALECCYFLAAFSLFAVAGFSLVLPRAYRLGLIELEGGRVYLTLFVRRQCFTDISSAAASVSDTLWHPGGAWDHFPRLQKGGLKCLFAHRPKRFGMEDRPVFGGRKPRGEVLEKEKKGSGTRPRGCGASRSTRRSSRPRTRAWTSSAAPRTPRRGRPRSLR